MPALDVLIVEPTPSGGLFHYAVQLGAGLARRGHRVRLLTGPDPELRPEQPGLVVLSELPTWHPGAGAGVGRLHAAVRRVGRAVRYHLAWLQILRRIRRDVPDVVLWSTYRFAVDGFLAALATRGRHAPVTAMVVHEPRPLAARRRRGALHRSGPLLRAGAARLYESLDVAYVLGSEARRLLLEHHPRVRNVAVIPHGDQSALMDGVDDPSSAASTEPVLLFFGAWTRYKGLPLLLDAFRAIAAEVPGARLVVAGAPGADVDVATLRRTAADLPGVDLRPGYVPVEAVPALLEEARAVVLPYLRASQSGVASLAHTFARPVVATAVGDLGELVEHGVSGVLVPPGDAAALAKAAVELLHDPELAARLGEAGRQRMGERGSWDAVAEQVEAELLAPVSARPRRVRAGRGT